MRNIISFFLYYRNFFIYLLSPLIVKILNFFLLPFYSNELTPENYAASGIIAGVIDFVSIFMTLQITGCGYSRLYIECDTKDEKDELTTFLFIFQFIFGILITAVICLAFYFVRNISFIARLDDNIDYVFYLAMITCFINQMSAIPYCRLRLEEKAKNVFVYTIINSIVTLVLSIVFVLLLKMRLVGLFLANFFAAILYFIILFPNNLPLRLTRSNSKGRDMIYMSVKTITTRVAQSVTRYSDKYFISYFENNFNLGLYQFASGLANNMEILVSSFNAYYYPKFFSARKKTAFYDYEKIHILYTCCIIILIMLLSEYILFVNAVYHNSIYYIYALMIYWYVFLYEYVINSEVHFFKHFGILTYTGIINVILNLFFNMAFIFLFGIFGVILGTILSSLIKVFIIYSFLKKKNCSVIFFPLSHIIICFTAILFTIALCIVAHRLNFMIQIRLCIKLLYLGLLSVVFFIFYKKIEGRYL